MLPLNRSESAIFTSSCAHHTPCLFVFSWSLWRDSFRCHSWGPFRPNYRKCLSEDRISDHLHSSLNSCCHSQYLRSPEIIFVKRRPRTENICPKLGCAFIWVLLVFMASETREDAQRYFTTAADDGQMSMCSWSIRSFEEFQKKKKYFENVKGSETFKWIKELILWGRYLCGCIQRTKQFDSTARLWCFYSSSSSHPSSLFCFVRFYNTTTAQRRPCTVAFKKRWPPAFFCLENWSTPLRSPPLSSALKTKSRNFAERRFPSISTTRRTDEV